MLRAGEPGRACRRGRACKGLPPVRNVDNY